MSSVALAGPVTAVGDSIQVESTVEGERFITTYEGVKEGSVSVGDEVALGQTMAKADEAAPIDIVCRALPRV